MPLTQQAPSIAQVILDDALDMTLDYQIPTNLLGKIVVGMRVIVTLRGKEKCATVIDLSRSSPHQKLAVIQETLPEKLSSDLFQLAQWISSYYCCSIRKALRLLLPAALRKRMAAKTQYFVQPLKTKKELVQLTQLLYRKNPSQAKVLECLLTAKKGMLLTELLEKAQVSKSPVVSLIKQQTITMEELVIDRSPIENFRYFQTKPKTLNEEQNQTLHRILQDMDANAFHVHLIHGVTGSGKTEIYMQAIAHCLQQNGSAILLVPEVSLTTQTVERFRSRFRENIGIMHHRLSDGQRVDIWRNMAAGKIRLAIGARSAIFSPLQNLKLIIVDEEHDPSYKQSEEAPCYHARDVAIMRAKIENCCTVLGSATPSLESFSNAKSGKFTLHQVSTRATGANLPQVHILDMKREYEKKGGFTLFSQDLLDGIQQRLEKGEQTILFLNRRGYHSQLLCKKCGHIEACPHCDVKLTYHREQNALLCHQCGFCQSPPAKECSSCKSGSHIAFKGAGTEQVQRALNAIFPKANVMRMDADTTRHKGSTEILYKQFRSGKADILIGTQMITKGLHFPSVTLVGVLNADSALSIPDFRSSERTFHQLIQVAGRAGRGALPGEVLIQTHLSDHYVIQLATKEVFEDFFEKEMEIRKFFDYPPFSNMLKIIFSSPDEKKLEQEAKQFQKRLLEMLPSSFTLFPLIPCGVAKIKDQWRSKILIRGKPIAFVSKAIGQLLQSYPLHPKVKVLIDVDPLTTWN